VIPILVRPGRGFDIRELDVPVTTSIALDKGDIVQLVQTSGGKWATCTGSGANTIAIAAATWTDATKTLTLTGAFTNYVYKSGDRVRITGGTGATAGFYVVASRASADAITLTTSIGVGADGQTDIAGSLLDRSLMQGIFGCALATTAANGRLKVRVIGRCQAFTKNSAGGGGSAIAAGNLYAASSAKDLESDTDTYGIGAKLIAKAIGTGTAAATNTRALRDVCMSGIHGWGGTYGGTA
jgi:predicted outer membrane repeat protein